MPLSLRLAALVAAGSAGGLQLPQASWRLLACLVAGAVGFAWVAHVCRVRGATRILVAVAVVGTAALRAVAVAGDAARPPLVRWFDRQTEGTVAGEARLRETAVKVRGRLVRDASATEYGAQIQLAVSDIEIDGIWQAGRGGLGVSIGGVQTARLQDWRAGRTIVVPVAIRRPTQYRNRGLPDQARALAWRGTPLVASAKSGLLVESEGPGAWWDEGAATMRAQVRAAMRRRVAPLDPMSAAIGTAILIGDRAELSPEVEQRLQEAGTYHVVAISGGNIALLAGAVLALLWIVGVRFAPAAGVTAVVLIAHAWVIGGGPSVVRATAMAGTYLALRLIDQRTHPVHAVAVAASGILLANPLEIAGAGFWLTFGATGALLMVAARVAGPLRRGWLTPLVGIILATAAVELLLTPVSAFVFERVTLAGLVLNLAADPRDGPGPGVCVVVRPGRRPGHGARGGPVRARHPRGCGRAGRELEPRDQGALGHLASAPAASRVAGGVLPDGGRLVVGEPAADRLPGPASRLAAHRDERAGPLGVDCLRAAREVATRFWRTASCDGDRRRTRGRSSRHHARGADAPGGRRRDRGRSRSTSATGWSGRRCGRVVCSIWTTSP